MTQAESLKRSSHTHQYGCQTSLTTGQIYLNVGHTRNTQHGPNDGLDSLHLSCEEKQDVTHCGFHHIHLRLDSLHIK